MEVWSHFCYTRQYLVELENVFARVMTQTINLTGIFLGDARLSSDLQGFSAHQKKLAGFDVSFSTQTELSGLIKVLVKIVTCWLSWRIGIAAGDDVIRRDMRAKTS